MAFPAYPTIPAAWPVRSQAATQAAFDAAAANTFDFFEGLGTWAGSWKDEAEGLEAALLTANLPSLSGQAGKKVQVNAGATGAEFVAGSLLVGVQTFTANGTYTPTSGVKKALLILTGGGGGGGGAKSLTNTTTSGAGGGGSAGATIVALVDVSAGSYSAAITIGAGGDGGTTEPEGGDAGLDSIYNDGTNVYTAGGGGGGFQSNGTGVRIAGAGDQSAATVSGAAAIFAGAGQAGGIGIGGGGGQAGGGAGGSSWWGGGGKGATSNANGSAVAGTNAGARGGGGGGAASVGATSGAVGGNGAPGLAVIYEYA